MPAFSTRFSIRNHNFNKSKLFYNKISSKTSISVRQHCNHSNSGEKELVKKINIEDNEYKNRSEQNWWGSFKKNTLEESKKPNWVFGGIVGLGLSTGLNALLLYWVSYLIDKNSRENTEKTESLKEIRGYIEQQWQINSDLISKLNLKIRQNSTRLAILSTNNRSEIDQHYQDDTKIKIALEHNNRLLERLKIIDDAIKGILSTVENLDDIKDVDNRVKTIWADLKKQEHQLKIAQSLNLSLLYYRLGSDELAFDEIKKVADILEKHNAHAHNLKAMAYTWLSYKEQDVAKQNQLLQECESYFDTAIGLDKNNPRFLSNKGFLLTRYSKPDLNKALEYHKKAYELAPNDPAVLNGYAVILHRIDKQNYAKALSLFNLALNYAPDNPGLLNNRSFLLLKMGKLEEALEDSKNANSLKPSDEDLINIHGKILAALGRHEEAYLEFEQAYKISHPTKLARCVYIYNRAKALFNQNIFTVDKKKENTTALKDALETINKYQDDKNVFVDEEDITIRDFRVKLEDIKKSLENKQGQVNTQSSTQKVPDKIAWLCTKNSGGIFRNTTKVKTLSMNEFKNLTTKELESFIQCTHVGETQHRIKPSP